MKYSAILALIVGQAACAAVEQPPTTTDTEQFNLPLSEVDASTAERGGGVFMDLAELGIVDAEKLEKPDLPFAQLGWVGVVSPNGPEVEYWGNDLDVSSQLA